MVLPEHCRDLGGAEGIWNTVAVLAGLVWWTTLRAWAACVEPSELLWAILALGFLPLVGIWRVTGQWNNCDCSFYESSLFLITFQSCWNFHQEVLLSHPAWVLCPPVCAGSQCSILWALCYDYAWMVIGPLFCFLKSTVEAKVGTSKNALARNLVKWLVPVLALYQRKAKKVKDCLPSCNTSSRNSSTALFAHLLWLLLCSPVCTQRMKEPVGLSARCWSCFLPGALLHLALYPAGRVTYTVIRAVQSHLHAHKQAFCFPVVKHISQQTAPSREMQGSEHACVLPGVLAGSGLEQKAEQEAAPVAQGKGLVLEEVAGEMQSSCLLGGRKGLSLGTGIACPGTCTLLVWTESSRMKTAWLCSRHFRWLCSLSKAFYLSAWCPWNAFSLTTSATLARSGSRLCNA